MPKQKGAARKLSPPSRPAKKLTALKRRFIDEYLICCNGAEAMRRCGIPASQAGKRAWDMLREPVVAAEIERRQKELAERYQVTQERIVAELCRIGFADIRNVVQWGEGLAVVNPETGAVHVANGIALRDSDELSPDVAAVIAEIAQGEKGVKVKLHNKLEALEKLGKHLGMFKQQVELTGADGQPLPPFEFHLHPPKA